VQRRARVRLIEEQAHTPQKAARDRLVVALSVAVHSADTLVEASDDVRQLFVEVDVGPAKH
jgi:hypothetical protein